MPFSSSYRLFLGLISLSPSFRKPQINVYIFQSMLTTISEQPRNLSGFTNFSFMLQSSESVPDWKSPLHRMIQGSRLFPSCGSASLLGSTQRCPRSHFHSNSWRGNETENLAWKWGKSLPLVLHSLSPDTQPPNCNGGWKCSQLCKPRRKTKQVWVIPQ